jgi:uncharacterized membrane protein
MSEQILRIEEHHLSMSQRLADAVTHFCGSWTFVGSFGGLVVVWIILNSIWLLFGVFDEYPYIALNLVLTVVSTLQGPLIMMSQNRQAERDRESVQGLHEKLDELERIMRHRDR